MNKKILIAVFALVLLIPLNPSFGQTDATGFSKPVNVGTPVGNSTTPQIIVSGNDVYVAWVNDEGGKFNVLFTRSSDGGSSFEDPITVSTTSTGSADNLKIVSDAGKIYSIWQSFSSNKSSILFSKSSDGGVTFGKIVEVNDDSKDSAFPVITVSNNHVYAVWLERTSGDITNVVFAKSDDDGKSFSKPLSITSHKGNSGIPKISQDGKNIYILWEDNSLGNFDVFLARSSDGGDTFGQTVNISDDPGDSGTPEMMVDGKKIDVVWMDNTSGNFDILFSKSTDGGTTFGSAVNVSENKSDSGYPQFKVLGQKVYVTWTNAISQKNYDVLFAKSDDGGNTFQKQVNVSNNEGASGWPQIDVDGNVYLSWVDNTPGNYEVFAAKSSDDGKTFGAPVNISGSKGESWYNRMALSPNVVYLVWQEAYDSGHKIMFAKSTTFVPEFGVIAPFVLLACMVTIVAVSKRSNLKF